MSDDGYYYLHTNGELIFKRHRPEVEPGGFVRRVWTLDVGDRCSAWIICIEAMAHAGRASTSWPRSGG